MFLGRRKHSAEPSDVEGGVAYHPNNATRRAMRQSERMVKKASKLYHHKIRSENRSSTDGRIYEVMETTRFRKDVKMMRKRGADIALLDGVIDMLSRGVKLPPSFKDHPLNGEMSVNRECHIRPDWLFVYRIEDERLVLLAVRTGTHSDIFD